MYLDKCIQKGVSYSIIGLIMVGYEGKIPLFDLDDILYLLNGLDRRISYLLRLHAVEKKGSSLRGF